MLLDMTVAALGAVAEDLIEWWIKYRGKQWPLTEYREDFFRRARRWPLPHPDKMKIAERMFEEVVRQVDLYGRPSPEQVRDIVGRAKLIIKTEWRTRKG